ncbi:septum formation inhibitor minc [Lucifera butyrica]|uniref:Probable septum site-determining protein MinC n=1 Tax=Lucifera butyrica TaxID=1351585 RepID=A0A498R576_9FIRM|nr:septum site-determining protein MinC [Lucifera butyrica]VBB07866.1 septum formation inhibitor minc [Lucifera butyrica]
MNEVIALKGIRDGLQLTFSTSMDFDLILEQLRAKLNSATEFFTAGTMIHVPDASRFFTPEQQGKLTNMLENYGLRWQESVLDDSEEYEDTPDDEIAKPVPGCETQALIITKTLRGGQKVIYEGTVVVIGDVNPGAEITAGRDIIVLGACRGRAHAGAYGNRQATITANKLLAGQIRIAGLIARAPDILDKPAYVETARIIDGTVMIEPANR